MVCLHTDLRAGPLPEATPVQAAWQRSAARLCKELDGIERSRKGNWGWSALYLCNERIYSPRHARGEPPHLDRVTAERPLRCVFFCPVDPRVNGLEEAWLREMSESYRLVARDRYPFPIYNKWDAAPQAVDDCIEIFKFLPKQDAKPHNN